uniref:Uncharacterized protein n=1 Tax=Anguilla anguilla TaxID=7936 RepID=A0A0E9QBM5_ANGAN
MKRCGGMKLIFSACKKGVCFIVTIKHGFYSWTIIYSMAHCLDCNGINI